MPPKHFAPMERTEGTGDFWGRRRPSTPKFNALLAYS